MTIRRHAFVLACVAFVACSDPLPAPVEAPVENRPALGDPKLSAPFDLGAVMRQVRFAYRAEGEGWRGGHATYDVRVGADGLELRPFHHPTSEREEQADVEQHRKRLDPARDLERPEPVEGAPLKLAPARIRRGNSLMTDGRSRAEQQKDGTLKLLREVGTERLVNSDEGVEQSWEFAARPEGTGALVVEIPVTGLAYAGVTAGGLHFRDEKTGLGFRYGHGTWIDANEGRSAIPARFEHGAIVLSVPEKLLASSAFPAVLDPVISPEFGMDEPVLGLAAENEQATPAVASNGTDYFVIWQDYRKGNNWDIYGTRVSAAGVVQDAAAVAISTVASAQSFPSIASNGEDYFVVWQDARNGWEDIYGTRVSAAGVVQDATGLVISAAANIQAYPAVASDGTDYFVAWQDYRSGTHIYGTRVSAAGVVQDADGLVISAAAGWQVSPAVASNGTDYFVAWEDYRSGSNYDIYGTRVSAAGVVQDAAGLVISAAAGWQVSPAVASNGTDYFVAWEDSRGGSNYDIYGTRVSAAGVVQEAAGLPISATADYQYYPAVASNGTDYFVAWEDSRSGSSWDIYGTRVSAAGVVLDASGLLISAAANDQRNPAVASNGTDYFVAWQDYRKGKDIYGARVNTAGVIQDVSGLLLSTAANTQTGPAVASNGTDYFVVWSDYRSGTPTIHGARVSAAGAILDAAGLTISSIQAGSYASVASNGIDYFVTWSDTRKGESDIYGARVNADGVVQDPAGLVICDAASWQHNPAVASNGTDYLVVWTDNRNGNQGTIYGARVSKAGAVRDPGGLVISTGAKWPDHPAVASAGANYFVAWHDYRSGSSYDIYGTRVSSAGLVQDPAGLAVSTATRDQTRSSVASNGTGYFVAWDDGRNINLDVYGTRVSSAGVVQDPAGLAVSTSTGNQRGTSVASNGTGYFVAWHDSRGGTWDLYGTKVSAAGVVKDPAGLLIAASGFNEQNIALAAADARRILAVYDRFSDSATTNTVRVHARLISDTVAPVASSADVTTSEDAPVMVTLTATDTDGDALTYDVTSTPANGKLSGDAPNLTYTPNANFNGSDSFTFVANDSFVDSAPATINITVTPVNDAPVATAQVLTVDEDDDLEITLTGADLEDDELTYAVATEPANGTLSGDAPDLTYTPNANFHGSDSFTFVANDGTIDSEPATISITVTPANDAPVAGEQSVTLAEDGTLEITLSGSDIENDVLSFAVSSSPVNGTLSGVAPNLTYTPDANFHGSDSFAFVANDGTVDSVPATVSITVTPLNDAPVAAAQDLIVDEDDALAILLSGSDVDGDELSFTVATGPANGTLSGVTPNLTYTPNANFNGSDSFTFVANDGTVDSEPATISITVTPVNDAPVAQSATLIGTQGEPLAIALEANDVDGDALTWTITNSPEEGTLSGTAPELIYEAPDGFRGTTTFTFKVSDGTLESNEATITIDVSNGAPTVTIASELLKPFEGQPVKFTATAADPGGDALTFEWDFGDENTSTELAPSHTYENQGEYEVSVTVSDGLATATATLTLEVLNAAPIVVPGSEEVTGEEGVELTFQAAYSDPGASDTLTVVWNFGDDSEPVTGEVVKHSYADDGTYTATVTVTDNDGAETVGTREVLIANMPPVPEQVATVTVNAGALATATLIATDRAGEADPLTWKLLEGPGELTDDGSYTWQTAATDEGTFVVKAQVSDDDEGTAESVFTVEVKRVEAPVTVDEEGCGCASSSGASSALLFGVLALILRTRCKARG